MVKPLPSNRLFIAMMSVLLFIAFCHAGSMLYLRQLPDTEGAVNIYDHLRNETQFFTIHIIEILAIGAFTVLADRFITRLVAVNQEYAQEEAERMKKIKT